ncbi:MAG TPA: hypothetical protein PLE92_11465, partial [Lentisphaeria bacterium]|nr:hypothetical protein [Lentisphaeria bacterium]
MTGQRNSLSLARGRPLPKIHSTIVERHQYPLRFHPADHAYQQLFSALEEDSRWHDRHCRPLFGG